MNRGDLRAAVLDALNRKDAVAQANVWLISAATRINTLLRHRKQMTHKILSASASIFPVPLDFVEAHSVNVNADVSGGAIRTGAASGALLYVPPAQLAELSAQAPFDRSTSAKYFTVHGMNMELAPWQAGNSVQVDMWYWAKLPALVADTDTNFFLSEYPHVYLNACLAFGHRFIFEYDTATNYEQLLVTEIQAINDTEEASRIGRGPLVMPPPARRLGGRFS